MGVKTPAFFVLYPGVDPTPDVERVGQKYNKSLADGTFRNVSMGQGQEKIALNYLIEAAKNGNWVMVQNVHLMTEWMKDFERQLEICQDDDPHPDFRCFISSEPPPMDHQEIIPESILQNAIKVSNEAPTNLKANMRRAISKFDEAYYDKAKEHKYNEFKALIFGLCMFHSLIVGRRKFGSIGWSRIYNFNDGDLTICGDILHNYLSKFEKVPYEDLKYLFGEIMYGGHITDNWDRRTNNTYLQVLIRPEILTQMQLTLYPGFKSPDPAKFERKTYEQYVEEKLPTEVPAMFGLHPNAEIGYLTNLGETIFSIILRISGSGGAGGKSAADVVKELISSFLGQLPESFNIVEITSRYAELTPYLIVSLQETERMNGLIGTIRFSLTELEQGLSGALNITDAMESLLSELARNVVPGSWTGVAYPSLKSLSEWFADLLLRI
jgi:dynein heavy chain